MKIAVCDDIRSERESLCLALQEAFAARGENCETYQFGSGIEFLEYAENHLGFFDFIFLDIFMGGITGMDTARELRLLGENTDIYFISSSSEFGPESYEVEAKGYFKKPVDEEKIHKIVDKQLLETKKPSIYVNIGKKKQYLYLNDIIYIENREHTATIHLSAGGKLSCSEKLKDLESRLSDCRFLRCNRSFLINMDYVKDVGDGFILKNNTKIPIKVRSKKEITDTYYNYFISKTIPGLKKQNI